MRDYIAKGHRLRKCGSYYRAIKFYLKANQRSEAIRERYAAAYMVAFTYVLLAHQTRTEACQLGTDLRMPYHDLYNEAGKQLDRLDREFDPKEFGLPALTEYEKKEINFYRCHND